MAIYQNYEKRLCHQNPFDLTSKTLQFQFSPFSYSNFNKKIFLFKIFKGVETIALESMLGLLQDILAQCQPNPQNVLLQLGLQFQLQQCWLSACKTENEFLLASASILRDKLRPICEPIVRNHYPKLIEKGDFLSEIILKFRSFC
ncbi:unnamed protein product [Meloidogyne enterolobii]|uniref:Uncharacterized protein n=1 Tax=Meloidogyne enterolobii TaxID=390850 RepID=A0ACB0Z0J2_MELEN